MKSLRDSYFFYIVLFYFFSTISYGQHSQYLKTNQELLDCLELEFFPITKNEDLTDTIAHKEYKGKDYYFIGRKNQPNIRNANKILEELAGRKPLHFINRLKSIKERYTKYYYKEWVTKINEKDAHFFGDRYMIIELIDKLIYKFELEIVQVNSDAELLDLVLKDCKEGKKLGREKFLFLDQYPTRFTKSILLKIDMDLPKMYLNGLLVLLENSQTPNLDSLFIQQFKRNWPSSFFDSAINLILGFRTKRSNDFLVNLLLDPKLDKEKKLFIAVRIFYSNEVIKLLSEKNINHIYSIAKENKNDLHYLSFLIGIIGKYDKNLLKAFYSMEYLKDVQEDVIGKIVRSINNSWDKNISKDFLKLHNEITNKD